MYLPFKRTNTAGDYEKSLSPLSVCPRVSASNYEYCLRNGKPGIQNIKCDTQTKAWNNNDRRFLSIIDLFLIIRAL